jgi:acetolactate synthase-1/3 small subunit
MQIVDVFRGKILDVAPASLTIEVTGTEEKVEGMINMLHDFHIREVVRSGKIAISRENKIAARRKKRG